MEKNMQNQILSKLNTTTFKTEHLNHRMVIEVGDEKQVDFKPRLKLKKWNNEVNFSVGVIEKEGVESFFENINNKIVWKQGGTEAHFYPIDGGFEFEAHLNEKPDTNIIEFSIKTKGLDFFYQPFLTEEEKISMEINRSEEVEGSYAVYHKSKKDNDYQTGKAFHIYRPKIIDAQGRWAWGIMNIDIDKEILSIEIPQSILDNGTYPLNIDPAFGYNTLGASYLGMSSNNLFGSLFTMDGINTLTSISVGFSTIGTGPFLYTLGIYKNSTSSLVAQTVQSGTHDTQFALAWETFAMVSNFTTEASTDYVLVILNKNSYKGGNVASIRYDVGSANQGYAITSGITYPTFPNSTAFAAATKSTNKISIYSTYIDIIYIDAPYLKPGFLII